MVFLLLSPHRVSEQGQNKTPKLYSSGTRSRNLRRARWHLCRLQWFVPGMILVQANAYSERREPHFSYNPQSWAAFRHWFWSVRGRDDTEKEEKRLSITYPNTFWVLYKAVCYAFYIAHINSTARQQGNMQTYSDTQCIHHHSAFSCGGKHFIWSYHWCGCSTWNYWG